MTVQLCDETQDAERYLNDDAWAAEQKLDGHRVYVEIRDGVVSPRNRHGELKSHWPRELRSVFENLPGNWTFDGELVGYTYWVFDLLAIPGQGDITSLPWIDRRRLLDQLFATAPNIPRCLRLSLYEVAAEGKRALYQRCLAENVEGVIFKKIDSRYTVQRGTRRCPDWKKLKFVKTVDCIVTQLDRKGKAESIGISLINAQGEREDAGGVRLLPKFRGKVTVDSVVELRYLYSVDGKKPIQPHILRVREDKRPEECLQSQLIITNKAVLKETN